MDGLRKGGAVEYRTLGRTGIKVSTYCLGTLAFGTKGNADPNDCGRIVHRAVDAGVNIVDTADMYGGGESEEILGAALRGRRNRVVVTSKFHFPMGGDDPLQGGNSRRWIHSAVEASLRRLRTEWIDLYLAHRPDPTCDIDETLGALTDLIHQGKVRAIGTSTFPAEELVEADHVARWRCRERLSCEQPPYSIFARAAETSVLPTCQKLGMGVMVWSPLNGGWLSGRYRAGRPAPAGSRAERGGITARYFADNPENRHKADLVEKLVQIARDADCSLAHLSARWTLEHPAVTSAIIGPRSLNQLDELLAGQDLRLSDDTLDAIDTVVGPGTDVNPDDANWSPPSLLASARRRAR